MSDPRPRRIDQVIPSIIEHDAVSNHTFEAQRLLRTLGFESEIFASTIGPGTAGRVRPIAELDSVTSAKDWLVYQCSIGSPVAERVVAHGGQVLVDYHNITPAHFVERWIPALAEESRLGRQQLPMLGAKALSSFADSSFNAVELVDNGFREVSVVPVLIDPVNLTARADEATAARLAATSRGAEWLFVGQVGAHKAQHDIISAFCCYRECYDPGARLHLVGREMGHGYRDALERFVTAIGLETAVQLTGSVAPGELVAHYEHADVFVCCSDHEGYCAPVIEAMSRSLPVVAYAAGAIPGTIGQGGVLLEDKSPAVVASAVHALLADEGARDELVAAGLEQAARHTLEGARAAFVDAIGHALELAEREAL